MVLNNRFSGAFSYSIAMTSARNFTVEGNTLFGNTTYIGAKGPNCSTTDTVPTPAPFVLDTNTSSSLTTQSDFQNIADGDALTCVLPPNGGDFWPIGTDPHQPGSTGGNSSGGGSGSGNSGGDTSNNGSGGLSGGAKAGIAVAVVVGVAAFAVGIWLIRKWGVRRAEEKKHYDDTKPSLLRES